MPRPQGIKNIASEISNFSDKFSHCVIYTDDGRDGELK